MKPIRPTELAFDAEKLHQALEQILKRYPLSSDFMQLALTHSSNAQTNETRAYDGLGTLFDPVRGGYRQDPADFVNFNGEFNDLYFSEVYRKVCEWSPLKIGRVRLMLRKPSSCYSMHGDEAERYHLAITTNSECYFFFKGVGIYQIPENGRLYHFDAKLMHTGLNAGPTDRVHLVFDTIDWRFSGPGDSIKIL